MSKITRELITLQVGHYANFVGTHWWNLQEASFVYNSSTPTDINHDFLFREGITPLRQETYTPRLLAIDCKGSLHSLPADGTLYSDHGGPSTNEASWDGKVELIQQLPQEKNDFLKDLEQDDARFQACPDEDKDICIDDSKIPEIENDSSKTYDLTKSISVWSDFLRPHLHPSTLYLFDNVMLNVGRAEGDSGACMCGFSTGHSAYRREEVEEEITDRIRSLAESCNSLQGFQILSDIHDGMGGVSYGILQHLSDEYGAKDTVTFATVSPHLTLATDQTNLMRQASIIQSFAELSQLSSVLVPLSLRKSVLDFEAPYTTFQHLALQEYNAYTTSSIIAAFLETVSLPYRHRTFPLPLANAVELLTPARRKIAGSSLAFPLGLGLNQSLSDWLHQGQSSSVSLSAGCDIELEPVSELLTIRGIPASRLNRSEMRMNTGRYFTRADQLYENFLQTSLKPPSLRHVASAIDPLQTPAPFPNIFNTPVTNEGYIDICQKASKKGVSSVPCMAGLHQGKGLATLLQQMLTAAKKFNVMKVPSLLKEGVDKETWADVTEDLQEITYSYCSNNDDTSSDDE